MRKIIFSKNIIEVYDTTVSIVGNGGYHEASNLEQQEKNFIQHSVSRRNLIRRLITNNFSNGDKFFTLTFAENETDIQKCNVEVKNFIKRLKYKYKLKDFKYLAVIEFQARGAVHYHMICTLPYIPQEELQGLWGNGFVWINNIKGVDNVGAYVVKYMNKEMADMRLKGQKAYLYSKNLVKPVEVTNCQNKNRDVFDFYNVMLENKIKNVAPAYEKDYENDFLGNVHYRQYKL